MISWLRGLDPSDHLSSPVKVKMKCCKSYDHFGWYVTDCSATRLPSWNLKGHYSWPTGGLVWVGSYLSTAVQSVYSTAPIDRTGKLVSDIIAITKRNSKDVSLWKIPLWIFSSSRVCSAVNSTFQFFMVFLIRFMILLDILYIFRHSLIQICRTIP